LSGRTTMATTPESAAPSRIESKPGLLAMLLLLLAVLLLGWWLLEQRGTVLFPRFSEPAPVATTQPSMTVLPDMNVTPGKRDRQRIASAANARAAKAHAPSFVVARPLSSPKPRYPISALRHNAGGTVVLRVAIDDNGTPTDVDILQRSGSRDLDRAAMTALRQWQFRPATRNGQPVASTVEVPVEFRPQSLASL
jgi:protein TonB